MFARIKKELARHSTILHVYALGICIMCGKQNVKWHQVVSAVYIIMHIVLTFSFAELISTVPFSGGGYGYSRCSLGPGLGYLAGMVELGKYIAFTSSTVYRVGLIFQDAYLFDDKYLFMIWLLFYVAVNVLHLFDMKWTWIAVGLLSLATVAIQLMFVSGAIEKGTTTNIGGSYWHTDPTLFLQGLPYASYLMVSADAVRACLDDEMLCRKFCACVSMVIAVIQSKITVPRALLHTLYWSALIAFACMVAQSAYVHDDMLLATGAYAYNKGTFGCAFGFLYSSARQVRSMALSGLLPPVLKKGFRASRVVVTSENEEGVALAVVPVENDVKESNEAAETEEGVLRVTKPTLALLVVSVLGYALNVIGYYKIEDAMTTYSDAGDYLRCFQYCFLMSAYVSFGTRFAAMSREMKSPFGLPGAVIVLAFFVTMFISSFYYGDDSKDQGIMLVFYFGLSGLYYVLVVRKRQFFSKEEQERFLKAYIVNANKQRRKKSSKKDGTLSAVFGYCSRAFGSNKVNPASSSKSKVRSG
eukprot:scaffold10822_cov288-Ochromonas_danica.AAC.1